MRRIVAPPSTHAVDTRGAFNPCELFSFAEGACGLATLPSGPHIRKGAGILEYTLNA